MSSKSVVDNGATKIIYLNSETGIVDMTYNGVEIDSSSTTIGIKPDGRLIFKVVVKGLRKLNYIKNVKLSIMANNMREDPIKLTLEDSLTSLSDEIIGDFVYNSQTSRYEVDIIDHVSDESKDTFYFGVLTEGSFLISLTSVSRPYMSAEYIDLFHFKNSGYYLNGSVGKKLGYKVNQRFGELYIEKQLYSFEGQLLPLNLSLIHNSNRCSKVIEEGMPNGWKFNYFQKLNIGEDYITYLDSKGIVHGFNETNDANVFVEESGAGLILNVINSGGSYSLRNCTNETLYFDSNGYLVKMSKKIGNNYLETTLEYDDSNRLISITDPMGNVAAISYNDYVIAISFNEITRFAINIDNYNQISSINERPGRITEFTYEFNLITSIYDDNGEKASFSYNSGRIESIVDSIYKDNVDSVLESRMIEYVSNQSKVTNFHGVTTEYTYDEDGDLICVNENQNNTLAKALEKEDMRKKYIMASNENAMILNSASVEITSSDSVTSKVSDEITFMTENNNFEPNTEYLVTVRYKVENIDYQGDTQKGYFKVYQDEVDAGEIIENEIGNLSLNLEMNRIITTCFTVTTNSTIYTPRFKLKLENSIGKVTLEYAAIKKCPKNTRKVCFSVGLSTDEQIVCEGDTWYHRPTPFVKVEYTDLNGNRVTKDVNIYEEDMKENIKNYEIARGGYQYFWYDKKRQVIKGNTIVLYIDDVNSYYIGALKMCIVNETDDKTIFTYDDYSNTGSETNILRTEYQKILFEGI